MCLPCIGRWILNHWTTNFFNMRKITEHMYSARNCQAERRSQHWKEKMEELLGQCSLEDHRGRELRWEHGRWNTVTGEKAEKKDAFLPFLYYLSSLPQWKKLTLALNHTAGSERLKSQYKWPNNSPFSRSIIWHFWASVWQLKNGRFLEIWSQELSLSLYGSRTKCFLCIDCITGCCGIGERPTIRNMACVLALWLCTRHGISWKFFLPN